MPDDLYPIDIVTWPWQPAGRLRRISVEDCCADAHRTGLDTLMDREADPGAPIETLGRGPA